MIVQIVGSGRMGSALHAALDRSPRFEVMPLAGRGATGAASEVVLLAVPDAEISRAASHIVPGPLIGHLSGATALAPFGDREAFSLHPLLTVAAEGAVFEGAYAAIAGTSSGALTVAEALAAELGLSTFEVRDPDRAAYHAAASIASNYLLTLEHFAETLAQTAGVPRQALVPLVRAGVENWAAMGAAGALTGPIARGDEATVERQRLAVAERMPQHLELFDALAAATRELAGSA